MVLIKEVCEVNGVATEDFVEDGLVFFVQ